MSASSSIRISHLTFAYPGEEPLYADLSLAFPPGWTALLGNNGIGKTTLARLAVGLPDSNGHVPVPQSGSITPSPTSGDLVSAWCPQETLMRPPALDDFAADWSKQAIRLRETLGIGDDWPYRYGSLSGGQRKRLQVACALDSHPDVLVLDEPTNHVDTTTRRKIAQALRPGGPHSPAVHFIGILISHDRDFIDAVADRCIFLTRAHTAHGNTTVARRFDGGYTQASAALRDEQQTASHSLETAQRTLARLEQAKSARQAAVQKANTLAASGRKINPKDHDALARHKLAHMTGLDKNAGQASARIDAHVNAARASVENSVVAAKRYASGLAGFFGGIEPSHRRELLSMPVGLVPFPGQDAGLHGLDDETAVPRGTNPRDGLAGSNGESANPGGKAANPAGGSDPSLRGILIPRLSVGPTDHIGLVGDNGMGKTTLLNALLARYHSTVPAREQAPILWIPQESTPEDTRHAVTALAALDPLARGKVLTAYAQLNSDPDRLLAVCSQAASSRSSGSHPSRALISPGELHKLLLCLGIVRARPQMIVMDEPTNHLDIDSVEALQNGLATYPGALLLVSHDQRFLRACTSITWKLDPDRDVRPLSSSNTSSGQPDTRLQVILGTEP